MWMLFPKPTKHFYAKEMSSLVNHVHDFISHLSQYITLTSNEDRSSLSGLQEPTRTAFEGFWM